MYRRYLKDTVEDYNYNVQKVRFLAAVMVIVSHAYPFSCLEEDPLALWTDTISLGSIAVYIFMFLSGLYSARSYKGVRCGQCGRFLASKIRRLCPSLFVTVTVTVLIVGSAFTCLTFKDYLSDASTWKYFLNCIFIIQHKLPGVFESNIYPESVNGSLWSLPMEVLCYVALTIAFKLQLLYEKMPVKIAVIEMLIGQVFIDCVVPNINLIKEYQYHLHLCLIFYLGALCYLQREKIYMDKAAWIACMILLFIMIYLRLPQRIWIYLLLYCVFATVFYNRGSNNAISFFGKYSYEIYLTGALIQQSVCCLFGGVMDPYVNMVISIPMAVVAGIGVQKISILLLCRII